MKVLALEGALGAFSASVAGDGTVLSSAVLEGNTALEAGLGAVRDVLERGSVTPREIDRLAVGIGPGGFTGLRITIAYAKSLAQAWDLPIAPVDSFDILEYGHGLRRALTVVRGRTGIISARYRDGDEIRRASGPVAEALATVLPVADARTLAVVGASEDVLAYLAEGGYDVNPMVALMTPPAAALALAGTHARNSTSIHEVRADYGEAPAAKIPTFRPTKREKR